MLHVFVLQVLCNLIDVHGNGGASSCSDNLDEFDNLDELDKSEEFDDFEDIYKFLNTW